MGYYGMPSDYQRYEENTLVSNITEETMLFRTKLEKSMSGFRVTI